MCCCDAGIHRLGQQRSILGPILLHIHPQQHLVNNTSHSWFCCDCSSYHFDMYFYWFRFTQPADGKGDTGSGVVFVNNQRPIVLEVAFPPCISISLCVYVCVCVRIYIYIYIYMCVCVCMYLYIYMYMCVCVCVCIYICVSTYI